MPVVPARARARRRRGESYRCARRRVVEIYGTSDQEQMPWVKAIRPTINRLPFVHFASIKDPFNALQSTIRRYQTRLEGVKGGVGGAVVVGGVGVEVRGCDDRMLSRLRTAPEHRPQRETNARNMYEFAHFAHFAPMLRPVPCTAEQDEEMPAAVGGYGGRRREVSK